MEERIVLSQTTRKARSKGKRSKSEADPVRVSVGGASHSLRMTDGQLKVGDRAQSL